MKKYECDECGERVEGSAYRLSCPECGGILIDRAEVAL